MLDLIKKFFHLLCVVITGATVSAALFLVLREIIKFAYGLDIFEEQTYQIFAKFWNDGGVLGAKELLVLTLFALCIILCIFFWCKIYRFKFIKLLTVPLNWLANRGIKDYKGMASVNIKNLKVEEKKTIEQIVQERIDLERKKENELPQNNNFRAKIIDEIEKKKEEI